MLGKKLDALMGLLSPASLDRMVRLHAGSGDKRAQWLMQWVSALPERHGLTAEAWWEEVRPDLAMGGGKEEGARRLRRWISYVTRECQKALVLQHLDDHPEEVTPTLVRISPPAWHEPVMHHFAAVALRHGTDHQDLDLMWLSRSHLIRSLLNQQSEPSLHRSLELVQEQMAGVRMLVHRRTLDAWAFLSSLYLDNAAVRDQMGKDFPSAEEVERLCRETAGTPLEPEFRLLQARFLYQEPEAFAEAIAASEALAQSLKGRQRDLVLRRIHFLQLMAGYGHRTGLAELQALSLRVHEVNEKLGLPDAAGFYHYLLLLILQGRTPEAAQALAARGDFYFPPTHQYLRDFLGGMAALLQPGHLRGSPSRLQALSYSRYVHLALWSGLLFAAHHLRLGNLELVETVLQRMRKKMEGHAGHFFTREASAAVLAWLEAELRQPGSAPAPWGHTPFHDAVLRVASA